MKLIRDNCAIHNACFLKKLKAAVYAIFDQQGRLLEGNVGFLQLTGLETDLPHAGKYIGDYFIQPTFQELSGTLPTPGENQVFEGLMTIGDGMHSYRTLNGAVFSSPDSFMLLGEYDVEDLESLNATVIKLNDELAQMQRKLARANRELVEQKKKITELMLTDPLTDLPNRRHLDQFITQSFAQADRDHTPFSLVIADIDHFKKFNDLYGHTVGDQVLVEFAKRLRRAVRTADFVARVGGEEFIIAYPNTGLEAAIDVTERLMEAVRGYMVPDIPKPVTASYGVAERVDRCELTELIQHADEALYQAKAFGRDQVAIYRPPASE